MAGNDLHRFSNHLSTETRNRRPNPMKSIWMLAASNVNAITLANGDPHHTLYPISQIDITVPSAASDDPCADWLAGTAQTQKLTSYKDQECALSLRAALQYGAGSGLPTVRTMLGELNRVLHGETPAHEITMTLGNADGITKCFRLLGDPGEAFLVEEFSFPGMTNAPLAHGVRWVPVRMDEGGIIPEAMEAIMRAWDEKTQGRRPHVLYIIPSGQNPTGSTLSTARRRQVYEIACRWDIIIMEDDPYYFLQYDREPIDTAIVERQGFGAAFAKTLVPSFLSMDTEGRVMRIDSFSKIIAPGMRLGWITSNALFSARLAELNDSSTQHPHGLGQALIAELLGPGGWGIDGFLRWVAGLCAHYARRRERLLSALRREVGAGGWASSELPAAGMFLWIKLHFEEHARYRPAEAGRASNVGELTQDLFQALLAAGLVVMPAKMFAISSDAGALSYDPIEDRLGHFRVTFAGTDEIMDRAMEIFGRVSREFFGKV